MKAILVMFDSLNRHMLPPYGNTWVHAPNFTWLAERTVTFDQHIIGSMPCIPARRELHTGRYNFLHRSWGPIEPFDESMPELLKTHGVYTHLTTDHQHYFEDGGLTYHTRYNSWYFVRGQEGDPWKAQVADPDIPENIRQVKTPTWRQDWVNRQHIQDEDEFPQALTFENGLEFLDTNHTQDSWFLQIETFDPHEPFYTPQRFKDLYPHEYDGPHFDWPDYLHVTETDDQVQHMLYEYAALVSMCDHHLGQVLDKMDEYDLWDDTLLIVLTDHGFLLGEHGFWAKNRQPLYQEIAHIPLFIWDPRTGEAGMRRQSLTQLIDIPATLLEYFGVDRPASMEGQPLVETLANDTPIRDAGMFGYHGCHINVTDGRYIYMRAPVNADNSPLHEYTLMPTHIKSRFHVGEFQEATFAPPFDFTKGCQTIKTGAQGSIGALNPMVWGSLLFDLENDPGQENPIDDPDIEMRMIEHLLNLMRANDAPLEQYERMGLPPEGAAGEDHLVLRRQPPPPEDAIGGLEVTWEGKARKMYYTMLSLIPFYLRRQFIAALERNLSAGEQGVFDEDSILSAMEKTAQENGFPMLVLIGSIVKAKG